MCSEFKMLKLKMPTMFYNKLEAIASANNKTVNDMALEMIHEKIKRTETEQKKEIVTDMLKDSGGKIIKS